MKVDYSKGKIYTIRSYSTDDVYIGSTCTTLTKRLSQHKRGYKLWLKKDYTYVTSYEVLKYGDAYIELVEEVACGNKAQLNRREGEVIRSMSCVNKNVAGRTQAEYRGENAEKLAALYKEYRVKNKETIAALQKEYRVKNKETIKAVQKQHYEKNKAYVLAHQKQHYEQNKAQIAALRAEKVTCGCGIVVTRRHLSRHEKTKKHEQYLNNLIRELDEDEETQACESADASGEGDQ